MACTEPALHCSFMRKCLGLHFLMNGQCTADSSSTSLYRYACSVAYILLVMARRSAFRSAQEAYLQVHGAAEAAWSAPTAIAHADISAGCSEPAELLRMQIFMQR